jgi:DNA-binding transcriptional regulator PaaX
MSKYKYYFRKPKSEITKDILKGLLFSGAVYIASSSPYFVINLIESFKKQKKWNRYKNKRIYNRFYDLQKEGCIKIEKKNHQIYVSLTEKGRKKAGWMQIDELIIKKTKKWDNKWRIVIFDISQLKLIHRNAFRGKLKELNFYPLQKSVWVSPYYCRDEIDLLRDFFGLLKKEVRLITANDIENDDFLRKIFKI